MTKDTRLYSGFMNHDYILTFSIANTENSRKLIEMCSSIWQGDEVTPTTWEISNSLSPDEMEKAILGLIGEGDRVSYYYLSDSKRMFRVVLR